MGKLPGQSHDEIARAVFLCNKRVPVMRTRAKM